MRCGPNVRYCPTARNFYLIRRILTETLGLPRAAIRPTSTFAELIPPQERQRVQKLFRQQKLNVLDLSLSPFQTAIGCFVPLVVLVLGVAIALLVDSGGLACVAWAGGIIAGGCTYELLSRRATEMSPTFTVKDAVVRVTRMGAYLKAGYELTSREEIFLKVCEIVARNLGANPEMLTEDTNFQEDLGAD